VIAGVWFAEDEVMECFIRRGRSFYAVNDIELKDGLIILCDSSIENNWSNC
jgi:hypothetical protein